MELEQVFSSCADATWVVRQDGVVIGANQAMLQFLGRSPDQVVGRRCKDLLAACICHGGACPLPAAHRHPSFHEYDIERRNDRRETEYFLVSTCSLVTLDGSPRIVAQFKDITLRKRAEEALERANVALGRLARIDGLTQAANRRSFDEALAREWQRLSREKAPLSLVLCDIDCFKRYNDHYGHQAGDECLRRVARTLNCCAKRAADMLARYGGEEFVFLLPPDPAGRCTNYCREGPAGSGADGTAPRGVRGQAGGDPELGSGHHGAVRHQRSRDARKGRRRSPLPGQGGWSQPGGDVLMWAQVPAKD